MPTFTGQTRCAARALGLCQAPKRCAADGPAQFRQCISTVIKYLENIVKNPHDAGKRRIKKDQKTLKAYVARAIGAGAGRYKP